MNNVHRLPPVLRVASILGLLFPLGPIIAMVLVIVASPSFSPQWEVNAIRLAMIVGDLGMVGLACRITVHAYNERFRLPDRRPFPLDSWQSQVRAILLPAALSICALVLAIVLSPTARAFEVVFPAALMGAGVCFVIAFDERRAGNRELTQPPRTE